MLKNRIIPVILMRNGIVVQSKGFKRYQALGNPASIVGRLSNWYSDELIYLDISKNAHYDLRRDDSNFKNRTGIAEILKDVAAQCFMPLTFGGGIRTLDDISMRLSLGADKVSINTQAFHNPDLVEQAAKRYGSQCVVVNIDVRKKESGDYEAYVDGGKTSTGKEVVAWAKQLESRGAGEILLNSIDNDGAAKGYDQNLIRAVVDAVNIPVIALGGVGEWQHFSEGLEAGANAVAAANVFQYTEHSVYRAKQYLFENGFNVREPVVESVVL